MVTYVVDSVDMDGTLRGVAGSVKFMDFLPGLVGEIGGRGAAGRVISDLWISDTVRADGTYRYRDYGLASALLQYVESVALLDSYVDTLIATVPGWNVAASQTFARAGYKKTEDDTSSVWSKRIQNY